MGEGDKDGIMNDLILLRGIQECTEPQQDKISRDVSESGHGFQRPSASTTNASKPAWNNAAAAD